MVIGMTDPVLGPTVMEGMRQIIRNCPEPVKLTAAGHFVQEWGEDVLRPLSRFYRERLDQKWLTNCHNGGSDSMHGHQP